MTRYNLHYAGSRLYTPDRFEVEAGRVGIARALPMWAVKNLSFGETILLASFTGQRNAEGRALRDSSDKPVRLGKADVWGTFVVNGLNIDAPVEVQARLHERLHIVRDEPMEPLEIERECGSYVIVSTVYVRESLREIVEVLEAVVWDYRWETYYWAYYVGIGPKPKVRVFVTGTKMWPLAPHISLDPVTFTRTIVKVDIEGFSPFVTPAEAEVDGHPIAFIADGSYSARRYKRLDPEAKAAAIRRQVESANRGRRARAAARASIANDGTEATA